MLEYVLIAVICLLVIALIVCVVVMINFKKKTPISADFSGALSTAMKTEADRLVTVQSELIRQTNNNIQNIVNLVTINNKQLEDRFINLTNSNEQRLEKMTKTVIKIKISIEICART